MGSIRVKSPGFPAGLVIDESYLVPGVDSYVQDSLGHPIPAQEDVQPFQHDEGESMEDMTVKELRDYAKAHAIPIPAMATSKKAILDVLTSVQEPQE